MPFSLTIQECCGKEAFKRRDQQKQRILNEEETRVLDQQDSTEEDASSNVLLDGTQPTNSLNDSSLFAKTMSLITCMSKSFLGSETLDDEEKIKYVKPKYADCIGLKRMLVFIALGAAFAVIPRFLPSSYVYVFALLSGSLIGAYRSSLSKNTTYPQHGYIVNALLAAEVDENIVIPIGFFIDRSWEFIIDSLLIVTGFFCSKFLMRMLLC